MTLKNSFLARLIENAKRRVWLLVVSLLVFVVGIPLYAGMYISVISQREYLIEENRVEEAMREFATMLFDSSNVGVFFFVGAFAVICGIQGFAYLYDRNKIDFYHSRPVKTSARFMSIWTNGVLVWLAPYILGMLINLLLFAANGVLDGQLLLSAGTHLLLATGFYFCVYHMAILALMLTGRLLVTILGIVIFLVYEVGIRYLAYFFHERFYHFFYVMDDEAWIRPLLSPVSYIDMHGSDQWSAGFTFFILLLFAAGVLVIAYWCYKKRPCERVGKAILYKPLQPIVKIGLAIPAGLAVGMITSDVVNYYPLFDEGSPAFPLVIGALGVIVTCCLMQVVYEADIKGIFHKKRHVLISVAAALTIVLVFRFDLTGYNRNIPKAEKIEYATVLTETGNGYSRVYLGGDLKWMIKQEYVNEYMRLTGKTAEAVRNLTLYSMDNYLQSSQELLWSNAPYRSMVVAFHQKNGRVICREVMVPISDPTAIAYIREIENSKEFITANENAMSEGLIRVLKGNDYKVTATWGTDVANYDLTKEQVAELLELYRMDVMKDNYGIRSTQLPVGELRVYVDMQVSYNDEMEFLIYPSYTNCINYLETNHFNTKEYVRLEDIEKISVTRHFSDEEALTQYEEYDKEAYYDVKATIAVDTNQKTLVGYDSPEQMQAILDASYPGCLQYESWYMWDAFENNYTIRVVFKENTQGYYRYGNDLDFSFVRGQVPDFVKNDLENAAMNRE